LHWQLSALQVLLLAEEVLQEAHLEVLLEMEEEVVEVVGAVVVVLMLEVRLKLLVEEAPRCHWGSAPLFGSAVHLLEQVVPLKVEVALVLSQRGLLKDLANQCLAPQAEVGCRAVAEVAEVELVSVGPMMVVGLEVQDVAELRAGLALAEADSVVH
jgi:hypothetical protein